MKNKKQIIVPPRNGWKARSVYHVEVCYNANNPVHGALFYTGFLNKDGNPCGYNEILTTEDFNSMSDVYFMRAINFICSEPEDITTSNKFKCECDGYDTTPLC